MSLLLDALKKAASEKEKHKSSKIDDPEVLVEKEKEIEESNVDSISIEEPEVLDLDLDLPENNEKFPDIDEDIENVIENQVSGIDHEDAQIGEHENKLNDYDEESTTDVLTEVIDDISEKEEAIKNTDEIMNSVNNQEDEIIKSEVKKVEELEQAEEVIILEGATEKKEASEVLTKQMDTKYEDEIKNKEALSALINKSNAYTRKNNLRTKILVASFITIILLATIVYLYFEFSADYQNIYVVDEVNQPERVSVIRQRETLDSVEAQSSLTNNLNTKVVSEINKVSSTVKSKVSSTDISKEKNAIKSAVSKRSVNENLIEIKHKTEKDPVGILVRKAFNAFNKQDYKTSEDLYLQANAEEPRNRDALLGLAAIAVKQQRYEYARQKYSQLRYLNPRDSLAIAGLSSIRERINSELSESELKYMLRDQPEAAHLYFALGSIYAAQKKWADAQASFFSAWSAENTNADYAFNLAVSLDQLGKKVQAKQLYETSLKLNQAKKGNFSTEIVEKRIETLNENSK